MKNFKIKTVTLINPISIRRNARVAAPTRTLEARWLHLEWINNSWLLAKTDKAVELIPVSNVASVEVELEEE